MPSLPVLVSSVAIAYESNSMVSPVLIGCCFFPCTEAMFLWDVVNATVLSCLKVVEHPPVILKASKTRINANDYSCIDLAIVLEEQLLVLVESCF